MSRHVRRLPAVLQRPEEGWSSLLLMLGMLLVLGLSIADARPLFLEAGRGQDAIDAYEHSLQMRPNDVNTIVPYLETLRQLDRDDAALELARTSEPFGRANTRFFDLWMNLEASKAGLAWTGGDGDRRLRVTQRAFSAHRRFMALILSGVGGSGCSGPRSAGASSEPPR